MRASSTTRLVSAFVAGSSFALGLALAGLTQPARVIGFLDFFGGWDPTLVLVMVGALAVYGVGCRFILARERPVLDAEFFVPDARPVDGRLVIGAALFGVGWGLGGFCPGPAVTALGTGASTVWVVFAGMVVGMVSHGQLQRALGFGEGTRDDG